MCTTPQTSSSLHASFRRQIMAGTGVTDITARQHFWPYPLASLFQRRPRPGHFLYFNLTAGDVPLEGDLADGILEDTDVSVLDLYSPHLLSKPMI
jgi:hypothetical protein